MAENSRPEQQPLLSGDGAPGTSAQQTAEASSASTPAAPGLQDFQSYEHRAQRIVTWTLYGLLFLVTVGTIIGVLMVSIPMQLGDQPPKIRKSAAIAVLQPEGELSAHVLPSRQFLPRALLQDAPAASNDSIAGRQLVLWSGKGHHADLVFNDLFSFDYRTRAWIRIYSYSPDLAQEELPIARWKALALYDQGANAMIVHGGDPMGAGNITDDYLDDFWRLDGRKVNKPIWQEARQEEVPPQGEEPNKKVKLPRARRAHAGVALTVRNESTLIIHGGRTKNGRLLADAWATSLEGPVLSWQRLFKEAGWSQGKKPVEVVGPQARKGHVAVSVQDDERPLMLIWGGRNDTDYFHNVWALDVVNRTWEEWPAQEGPTPSGRDHLGAFFHNGICYIYGGRGGATYDESAALGDLWGFNIAERQWKQIYPTGPVPPKRFLYSMDVYTVETAGGSTDARLVIFGGEGELGCYLNDLWEYSVADNSWSLLSPLWTSKKHCRRLAPIA